MTFTIPKWAGFALGALIILAIGIGGTLLLTGDDGGSDSKEVRVPAASSPVAEANSPEEDGGDFGSAGVIAIDSADSALHEAFSASLGSLGPCEALAAAGRNADVGTCIQRKFAPLEAAFGAMITQLERGVAAAPDGCANALAPSQSALMISQSAVEQVQDAFVAQNYDAANVGEMSRSYDAYRAAMDESLRTCARTVPGLEVNGGS